MRIDRVTSHGSIPPVWLVEPGSIGHHASCRAPIFYVRKARSVLNRITASAELPAVKTHAPGGPIPRMTITCAQVQAAYAPPPAFPARRDHRIAYRQQSASDLSRYERPAKSRTLRQRILRTWGERSGVRSLSEEVGVRSLAGGLRRVALRTWVGGQRSAGDLACRGGEIGGYSNFPNLLLAKRPRIAG